MSTLTSLLASNIMGAGTKMVRATFAGPAVYVDGGTPCNLATKPAAAAPVTDAALTSPMLARSVDDVQIQIPAAMENLYRVRYVPGAGEDPALGLAKVFGPASVLTEVVIPFDDPLFGGAGTATVPLIPALNPGTRIVGGEVEISEAFGDAAAGMTTLTLDIGIVGGDVDGIIDSGNLFGAPIGTVDQTAGALAVVGMWSPAAAVAVNCDVNADANLNTLTAGSATVRVWTVDVDAFGDPATWGEIAAGTDLLAAGLTFTVTAIGM